MSYPLLIAGVIIILTIYADFAYTTLSTNGAGFISNIVTQAIWKIFILLSGGNGSRFILKFAGVATVVALLIFWVAMIWMGNALIFLSDRSSVVDSITNTPVGSFDVVYFVGYTIFTLGNGDLKGGDTLWRNYSAIVSVSGLSILTIAISYMVQVLSAVTDKRHLSIYISSMGDSPQKILMQAWNGRNFEKLEPHFLELTTRILYHDQNYLSYPILHQFHSTKAKEAEGINLVALDEAISMLLICVPKEHRPASLDVSALRKSITAYLINLEDNFFSMAKHSPPLPDLKVLKDAGIPVIEDEAYIQERYHELEDRRRLLMAYLHHQAWEWSDLSAPRFPTHPKLNRLGQEK
jgi:hypothetical protein